MAIETISCDVLVIGAGVIGLASAAKIVSRKSRTTILIDANSQFGQETSSRNSEVVHSGIYYPVGSKKTAWCIDGRKSLYDYCRENNIGAKKVGKLVVATNQDERAYLEKLSAHARSLSVPHEWVTGSQAQNREPLIRVDSALFFSETGIVDSHALMANFESRFEKLGGMLAYDHKLVSISRGPHAWEILVTSPAGELKISSPKIVNAAGLNAARISNEALNTKRYEHRYCRGRYFGISSKYQNKFSHLVYPVPQKDGLGIHVTVDLEGFVRLGPDVDWCDSTENLYHCKWEELQGPFTAAVNRYFPALKREELTPGLIGIRPKLFLDGTAHPDFLVEEKDGFIHCLGIESPGLTSSLIIADQVANLLEDR
jgi:L-2-hydroxyglutarate oxidase LhgO